MNRQNRRKTLLLGSMATIALVGASVSSFTYANFVVDKYINQPVRFNGMVPKTIYLNANIWSVSDPIYYMFLSNDDGSSHMWIQSSIVITPTIAGTEFTLYVFEIDLTVYTKFFLARINPNPTGTHTQDVITINDPDFSDKESMWQSWRADAEGRVLWNVTKDISVASDTDNYYCIEEWRTSGETGDAELKCRYETNNLYVTVDGVLAFSR